MESQKSGGITLARLPASGPRGSATAKETCWESGSRFGLDGSAWLFVVRLHAHHGIDRSRSSKNPIPVVRLWPLTDMPKNAIDVANWGYISFKILGVGSPQ